jgi:methylase of polypeptide subunit release factors
MRRVVVVNAFSLAMLQQTESLVLVKRITLEEAKKMLQAGFESAVGHESTANVLSQLLGIQIKAERRQITLTSDTILLVFQLLSRLPEGKILSMEELMQVQYAFYTVELLDIGISPPQRG